MTKKTHTNLDMVSYKSTKFFGTQATRWSELYKRKDCFRDRLNLFCKYVVDLTPKGGNVLDFGCGTGNISMMIAKIGYEVLAVDGAVEMLNVARKEAENKALTSIRFKVMNDKSFDIAPETFDSVICSSVIEYIENDVALLSDLAKTIKPHGHLIISAPHTASIFGSIEDWFRKISIYSNAESRRHLLYSKRRYRKESLSRMLIEAGIEPMRITFFESMIPGSLGILLSRVQYFGRMMIVVGRKY